MNPKLIITESGHPPYGYIKDCVLIRFSDMTYKFLYPEDLVPKIIQNYSDGFIDIGNPLQRMRWYATHSHTIAPKMIHGDVTDVEVVRYNLKPMKKARVLARAHFSNCTIFMDLNNQLSLKSYFSYNTEQINSYKLTAMLDNACDALFKTKKEGSMYTITDIIWDGDDEDKEILKGLPTSITLPADIDPNDEDAVNDYLAEVTGFCNRGYQITYTDKEEHNGEGKT